MELHFRPLCLQGVPRKQVPRRAALVRQERVSTSDPMNTPHHCAGPNQTHITPDEFSPCISASRPRLGRRFDPEACVCIQSVSITPRNFTQQDHRVAYFRSNISLDNLFIGMQIHNFDCNGRTTLVVLALDHQGTKHVPSPCMRLQ